MSLIDPRAGTTFALERQATLINADASEHVRTSPSARVAFVAPGNLTGGRFGLFRYEMGPRARGASPHVHTSFSESFYVLSGAVALNDGDRWISAGPGSFLHVPERSVHGFRNDTDESASLLILFAPAPPREAFFRELADIVASGRQLSEDEWTEFYRRHDQFMVK
jgi:quercetin dioxygenase-like cupin family protein